MREPRRRILCVVDGVVDDPDPHQLNWTLIPEELATANLSRVGPSTVAFHAVGMAAS